MKIDREARKLLRKLLDVRGQNDSALIEQINADPVLSDALKYLESKNLVKVTRNWGLEVVAVQPLNDGIAYLPDRAAERRRRWADRLIGFVLGVLSTFVAELIVKAILHTIK